MGQLRSIRSVAATHHSLIIMIKRFQLVLIATASVHGAAACGRVTETDASTIADPSGDAGGRSHGGSADAGGFECGATICSESEICVYPPCGCVALSAPKNDAGQCPSGFQSRDDGTCFQPPHCPSQPPYCATPGQDGQLFECSGKDGTLNGFIDRPVANPGSRVCYDSCV